ncbi:MAG: hydroxymethylpyrimidine/phosphomethylpyrimidine kinase [Gammaproteobacteria bacterium]|nr:hydroxymethylpyrimidine/phosphomethylpyrimidine kinase [Gammaproteobacteria bacterium]
MDTTESTVVMCFSGLDPTGGAGIQADIETLASMGCHASPVITTITSQDTQNVKGLIPLDVGTIVEQARAVLEDMPVHGFKIGLLGSVDAVEAVHSILQDYRNIPVVFDPVLRAGGGAMVSDPEIQDAMASLLVPESTFITPNSWEARMLCHEADNLDACAHELMDMGAEYVLLTGTHENTEKVINVLYGNSRMMDRYEWERLPHDYHGSGCILASAVAALLAQGLDPLATAREAQEFTWQSLKAAIRLGMGQWIPNRFFWAVGEESGE